MKSKMKFSENLKRCINAASQDVAADWEPEMGKQTKKGVAEICIDANRLRSIYDSKAGREADEEVTRLVDEFGYEKVLREASKYVSTW